ncbi:hypothetical protein GEV33_004810 [Tenebrio molitor]|uniref:Uncharacterized protein n=1 Tax=Tenebrio molitor TaxID=7067 RepID=A0A8J6HP09_TENMO|nr:hypothetical protein GEV33_004810 [Tenebrio molitor]
MLIKMQFGKLSSTRRELAKFIMERIRRNGSTLKLDACRRIWSDFPLPRHFSTPSRYLGPIREASSGRSRRPLAPGPTISGFSSGGPRLHLDDAAQEGDIDGDVPLMNGEDGVRDRPRTIPGAALDMNLKIHRTICCRQKRDPGHKKSTKWIFDYPVGGERRSTLFQSWEPVQIGTSPRSKNAWLIKKYAASSSERSDLFVLEAREQPCVGIQLPNNMDHHFPSSPIRRRLRIPFPRRLAANARASRLLPFSAVSSAAKRACAVIEEAAAAPTLPAADLSVHHIWSE